MLGISMRSDWRYLDDHGDTDGRGEAENYYEEAVTRHGEPRGRWEGRGAEMLGLTGEVSTRLMDKVYGRLEHPLSGEALGSRPRQYATYEERLATALEAEPEADPERLAQIELEVAGSGREARHYADFTFSPTKSWSVAHAALQNAGRNVEAEILWDCLMEGARAGVAYAAEHAGASRKGYHGRPVAGRTSGEWVDARDFVVSMFKHHTSRDGDPQLHIHAAVLNRVECADGEWRSLDSKALYAARPGAAAIAGRVAEELAAERLGVRFIERDDGNGREIDGISPEALNLFSSRRQAILNGVGEVKGLHEMVADFVADRGRQPSRYERRLMSEMITLATRAPKPANPLSVEDRLAEWDARHRLAFGGDGLDSVLSAIRRDDVPGPEVDFDSEAVITKAVARVEASKTVWNRHDLRRAIMAQLPERLGVTSAADIEAVVGQLVDKALRSEHVVTLTAPALIEIPRALRRADGRSRFEPNDPQRFASSAQLTRDERLIEFGEARTGVRTPAYEVSAALAEHSLAPEQKDFVQDLLSSGKRLQILVGPAGTGKSRTLAAAEVLWKDKIGGRVIGLTTSQAAASVLRHEGMSEAYNLTWFFMNQQGLADKGPMDKRTLLVVDETSMVPNVHLDRVLWTAEQTGATVVLAGDPSQLDAVGSGGAMGLAMRTGRAHHLETVRRFRAQWEGSASLQLRDGDAQALLEYRKRGRIFEGQAAAMEQHAIDNYTADFVAGRDTLLITSTNEKATELSNRVREQLVGLGLVEAEGVALRTGSRAGVGDVIQARHNEFGGGPGGYSFVNRQLYRVEALDNRRGLVVRRLLGRDDHGEQRYAEAQTMSNYYVKTHAELAYGVTAHAAQGRTVDTSHVVVDDQSDRKTFYVPMTRGREQNIAYVGVVYDEDGRPAESGLEILRQVLNRDSTAVSATETQREELEAVDHLARLGPIFEVVSAEDSAEKNHRHLAQLVGSVIADEVRRDEAASALYRLIRSAELEGRDVAALMGRAVGERELRSADSVAQVLHFRLERLLQREPTPEHAPKEDARPAWQRRHVDVLEPGTDEVSVYLREVAEAMDAKTSQLGERAATDVPDWAREHLGEPAEDDALARAEWCERAGVVAGYRERYGIEGADAIGRCPGRGAPERQAGWQRAYEALGRPVGQADVARGSDGQLRNVVDSWRRIEAQLPPNVDIELERTHKAIRTFETRLVKNRRAAETAPANESDVLRQRAKRSETILIESLRPRAAKLEEVASARAETVAHYEPQKVAAEAAREELARRETARQRDTEVGDAARESHAGQSPTEEHHEREGSEMTTPSHQRQTEEPVHEPMPGTVEDAAPQPEPVVPEPSLPIPESEPKRPVSPARHERGEAEKREVERRERAARETESKREVVDLDAAVRRARGAVEQVRSVRAAQEVQRQAQAELQADAARRQAAERAAETHRSPERNN